MVKTNSALNLSAKYEKFSHLHCAVSKNISFLAISLPPHWGVVTETEPNIKEETKATICYASLDSTLEEWTRVYSGKPSKRCALLTAAY